MRLRGKRACLVAGCLSIAMLCALVVAKKLRADHEMTVWRNADENTEQSTDVVGGQDGSVNTTDSQDGSVNMADSQDGSVHMADSQERTTGIADGQQTADASGRGDMNIKKVALTFDDGPHPRYTEQLLEGLRSRNVRVTFFVLGQSAELYPDLIREMAQDGHLIGNHTYSHIQLTSRNGQRFAEELQKTDAIIYELTGQHTEFVRPPFGVWDKSYEESLNMIQVLWNVDPLDWCCSDAGTVTSRVLSKADEGCIILLHDVYATSVEAALAIIDELSAQGYEFVTVDEIILD